MVAPGSAARLADAEGDGNLKRGARSVSVFRVRRRDFASRGAADVIGPVMLVVVHRSRAVNMPIGSAGPWRERTGRRGAGSFASVTLRATKRVKKRRQQQPECTAIGRKPIRSRVSGRRIIRERDPTRVGVRRTDLVTSGQSPAFIANL